MQQTIQITPEALQVIASVRQALAKSPTGVSFCSIKNYVNLQGEKADHLFNVGVSYEKAKEKDIAFLNSIDVTTMEWQSAMVDIIKAKQQLITSLETETKENNIYTYLNTGIKVHNETGEIYVYGMREKKTIKEAVDYGEDTRRPLTIAKDEIRKLLKSTKYRQFKFNLNGMTIKISGNEITFEKPTA